MKPKKSRKLRLSKETIDNLNRPDMAQVLGGETETVTCQTCATCATQLMCTGCKPSRTYCD
jgi:hypothetical protein